MKSEPQCLRELTYGIIPMGLLYSEIKATDRFEDDYTAALYIAQECGVPSPQFEHDPSWQNSYGMTVAMYLADNKMQIPKQWHHDPTIKNKYNDTVAMWLAYRGIVPPEEWQHDPTLIDVRGNTVESLLKEKGIEVPSRWQTQDKYKRALLQIKQILDEVLKDE